MVQSNNMASAVPDEWTEEKCLQLVREYRARPMLWDPKDPLYFKKTMKPVGWDEISDAIDVPAERCKAKMIVMMSSFRREKSKIVHSLREKSAKDAYRSTWFAFKEMSFLIDKENERKRQLGVEDENETERSIIQRTLLKHHVTPADAPIKKRRKLKLHEKMLAREIKEKETGEDTPSPVPIAPIAPEPGSSTSERDEEIKSFTSFVGTKMKRYSEKTKNAVQQAICEIIFKADQNYYENVEMDPFTLVDENEGNDSEPTELIMKHDVSDSD